MSLPASTFNTYDSVGNREDLSDIIYRISPTETPFVSGVDKTKATAVNHEWQTQELAAAAGNAVLEGDDATTDAATPTIRLGNYAQISDKVARVTGTQQVIEKAGRENELSYQMMLKGKELKRDMEFILVGANTAKVSGGTATARKTASVLSWIGTNDDFGGGGGASPTTLDGLATRTDGTQRAFQESQLKTVLQACWTEGGEPDTIMVGGFNKQAFSSFIGRGTPFEDVKSKTIMASVDVYESDFGKLKVLANRFSRSRDALVLQMDMWGLAYLRNMKTIDLAVTGDNVRRQILCEYSLESRNEKSSGGVFDLTTS